MSAIMNVCGKFSVCVVSCSLGVVLSICISTGAQASAQFSWTDTVPVVTSVTDDISDGSVCRMEEIKVASETIVPETGQFYSKLQGCVLHGATIDVAQYGSRSYKAIRIGAEALYHQFLPDSDIGYLVPGTDTYVSLARGPFASAPSTLVTYRSLPLALVPAAKNSFGTVTLYRIDRSKGTTWLPKVNDDGTVGYRDVYGMVSSENGRYILAYVERLLFVKIDLQTGLQTVILSRPSAWYSSPPTSPLAISDDGRYAHMGAVEEIIDTRGCGDGYETIGQRDMRYLLHPCISRSINTLLQDTAGYPAYSMRSSFIDDGQGLIITASLYPGMYGYTGPSSPKKIELHGANYVPSMRLDYLALGDSYSSGEGDIAKKADGTSFYLRGTEPDGQCHISSRSYPFLLRNYWKVQEDKMQSVACSGARVVFDYSRPLEGYRGQGNRLAHLSSSQRNEVQASSIDDFTPGNIPQIEFVKKYRPKIVTFTGGGNDVGFADILQYCAGYFTIWNYIPLFDTCGYVSDETMRANLNGYIDDQYLYNKKFIDMIKQASPDSEVYVVGYPRFIADHGICGPNTALLNGAEMKMINDSVSRLNKVLRLVAQDTGTVYLDNEYALEGGRLCEGSKYVIGYASGGFNAKNPAMFHPNAAGHEQIAEALESAYSRYLHDGASDDVEVLDAPAATHRIVRLPLVETGSVQQGKSIRISLPANTLDPQSVAKIKIQSKPTELPDTSASETGGLDYSVQLPEGVEPGFHLLTVTGTSVSGEALQIQQFITITSDNRDDSDGDGITNALDGCFGIKEWYDDAGNDTCLVAVAASTDNAPASSEVVGTRSVDTTDEVALASTWSLPATETGGFFGAGQPSGDNVAIPLFTQQATVQPQGGAQCGDALARPWLLYTIGGILVAIIITMLVRTAHYGKSSKN